MKKILTLAILIVLFTVSALAQPTPQAKPPSPESLGIQAPTPTSSTQAPPTSESTQTLIATSESSARAAGSSTRSISTSPSLTAIIVPPGTTSPNKFYVPYTPSTVASCYFGQWLPLWLNVQGTGQLYSYEWYPNGRLVSQYLTNIRSPSWQKMWFNGDATGWHTLQYYCSGWSNYIYIYVYGSYTPTPTPPSPYPPSPYPPTSGCNAQVTITSSSIRGYSVYVDDNYIGGDGIGNPRDGTYSFTVSGNQQHSIKVYSNGFSYSQTKFYSCGNRYTLKV
ncbi:MAG: hypothetical protein WB392_13930 [Methanotrichaceae archaeon]